MRIGAMTQRFEPLLAAAVLVLAALTVVVAFYPGRYSLDSLMIFSQAQTGVYHDFHTPLLQWSWHLVWGLGIHERAVFVLQVCVAVAGIYSIIRLALGRLGAAVGTLIVVISPLTYGQLALLGRDAWYLGGLLILFGAAAKVLRTKRSYWPWVAAAVGGAWIALAARQNAAPAVFVGLSTVAFLVATGRQFPASPLRPLAISCAIGLASLVALLGAQSAHKSIIGVDKIHPEVILYVYDLTGMSLHDHQDYFPPTSLTKAESERLHIYFNPYEVLDLNTTGSPFAYKTYNQPWHKKHAAELRKAWIDAATSHPTTYLKVRSRIFLRQASVTGKTMTVYYADNNALGDAYPTKFSRPNNLSRDYMNLFIDKYGRGGPLFTVWVYLLFALVAMVMLLRRRSLPAWLAAATLAAALAHQLGIFFGIQGVAYRFEFPAVTLIVTIGVTCAGVALKQLAAKRGLSTPAKDPQPATT
jgi:hypothetical protein